jgi:two-component system chemotaxis sensor kinase CheA
MNDEMDEIIREFITEAEESLEKIEPRFVELEQKGQNTALLNDIFRSMHTIKGAAGFLGFQSIVNVAHASENIMKKLRDGEIEISKSLMDVILKSIDMLRLLLGHLDEKDGVEEDVAPLVREMNTVLQAALSQDEYHEQINISHGTDDTASVPLQTSESSILDIQGEEPPAPENTAPDKKATVENSPETNDVNQIPETAPAESEQKPHEVTHTAKDNVQKAQNLRVDVNRIDKVMDLAGEVVLVRNRLLNISNYFDMKYTDDEMTEILMESVSFLDRITSDMQVAVMKIRMQPIKKVLSKFPRLVRDMSTSVKKDVELQIFGEGTEVDKTVIENIGDPLTHILRNSIDHGLESADERISKGKSPKGNIIINTYQKGTQIVIEITDDGKGIDIEKLKKKAVEKGLVTEEGARKMSDKDAIDIIFLPGFSTKDVASELSGRGVGMDVVKTNISLLNGYVEVSTEKDAGTTFKISIPLTLAIIQALMVEVGGSKYAIPLSPIEETLKVSKKDINNITGQNVIVIRDRVCPLFDLNNVFGIVSDGPDDFEYKHLIVISLGDKKFCLAVDRLVGQEEVVIKTLNGLDATSSYVLGATITGDGKVVFILDVAGISRSLLGLSKV